VRFVAHSINNEFYITDHSNPFVAGHLLFFCSPFRPARVICWSDGPSGMPSESWLPAMRHSVRLGFLRATYRMIYGVRHWFWPISAKCLLHRPHYLTTRNKWLLYITHTLTHGAEPFLGSFQLCSYSRTSQHFIEPGGSLPCSQEPSTGLYPEPDQSSPYHPILDINL
jgi:hypothetical protein